MSEILQYQVQGAQADFVRENRNLIKQSSYFTFNMVVAIVALMIAIMAFEYYRRLDAKIEQTGINTQLLLKSTESNKSESELKAEADAIAVGDNVEIDPVEIEGDANAGVSEDIEIGIVGIERMYNNRYYSELDKVSK